MNCNTEIVARWPEATPEQIDTLLWMTPFPFVTSALVIKHLDMLKATYGDATIVGVIEGEQAEFDRIWEETREQREKDLE